MGFAGELATIGLPEVFQNIAFNRMTGVLTVRDRTRRAAIYFEEGLVRAVRPCAGRHLDYLAIARRSNAAPPDVLREASRRRRRKTLRQAVRADDFDAEAFDAAVQAAVKEEILLVFGWREASFTFEEVRPEEGLFDREQLGCEIHIVPGDLATEAAHRNEEWDSISHLIHSEADIFLAVDQPTEDDFASEVGDVMRRLDGTRDLRTLVGELPHGRYHVMRVVAGLIEKGQVERATPQRLCELARIAEEAREIKRAVSHLEAAVKMDGSNIDARNELVRLYELGGRRADAAREHKRLARLWEQKGDLGGALEAYRRAADLAPYETDSLEKIVEIHDARGDKVEFMHAGRRLAEALSKQRLPEEALDVYRRLLERDENNIELRESIAAAYIRMHERKSAVRELLSLGQHAWDHHEFGRALRYYRNVLAVDRNCEEAKGRIEEIERGRLSDRRVRHRRRAVLLIATLLLALGAWQAVREWLAHSALNGAAHAALSGVPHRAKDETIVEALERYAVVCEDFPFTFAAWDAEESVRTLALDVLTRITVLAEHDPEAAERLIRRLGRVHLPESVQPLWRDGRDRILHALTRG